MGERRPVIGLLYAGEMGAALGRALRDRGLRVVTTAAGRGPRTLGRATDAGLELVGSFRDVVAAGDVVLSVVPPAAAEAVAGEYGRWAALAPAGAVYVDVNSIGPEAAGRVSRTVTAAGRDVVDAAVNGLAKNLSAGGTLFLSGGRAGEVARLFEGVVRVRALGAEPGAASAMKMLLAGLSKGICGLYAELALVAERRGMAGAFAAACAEVYPGIAALAGRMLPTYVRHAARRATETAEVEQTARACGLEPTVLTAVRRLHEDLADALAGTAAAADSGGGDSAEQFMRHLAARGFGAAAERAGDVTRGTRAEA